MQNNVLQCKLKCLMQIITLRKPCVHLYYNLHIDQIFQKILYLQVLRSKMNKTEKQFKVNFFSF